jgi:DNA-binding MarR family transcriptional regulator
MGSRVSRRSGTRGARRTSPGATSRRVDTAASIDSVRRIVRALRMAASRTEREAGISAAQLFVLSHLSQAPAASLSELGTRTLTDRSSVAAVVERLVMRGLVTREQSADDARRTAVRITTRGKALLRRAPRAPTELLMTALGHLGAIELHTLAIALSRLSEAMGLATSRPALLFEDEQPDGERKRLERAPNARPRGDPRE